MTAMQNEDIPIYLRLRGLIAASILEGRYGEGNHLPAVRAFAAQVGANPLTVAKAYQTLQDEGYVVVRRGVGMFVADGAIAKLTVHERDIFLTKIWPRMRDLIDRLDSDIAELMEHEPA